ncbi:hypothetical protein Syun_026609 [Stephania yunnanensis]|uniref:Transmembrane protein 87A n=1 Tax=Stephania yunnanensis TaxID=152371 RepID=A0AAP0F2S3_9MAGN
MATIDRYVAMCLWILCLVPIEGSVHEYNSERFGSKGNAFVVHGGSEGVYSSVLSLNESEGLGSGDSFIRFEKVAFRRPKEAAQSASGLIQAIVFEVEDRDLIGGSAYGGQRAVCCTPDLAKQGFCVEGEVIKFPSKKNPNWPHVLSTSFEADEVVVTMQTTSIQITETGMYNLYFFHCDPNLKELVVEGKTIWKNPNGYLPEGWLHSEVLQLQNCITLVITLGMFEMALWYFEFAEFNKSGVRPVGITFWAVTFGTIKRTISRVIILIVSMGYGVVRPTLGGLTKKVLMLGGTFFVASEVLEIVENVGAVNDLAGKARLFLVLPVAILDVFFILWIFTSLSTTFNKLQARRLMAKLEIYRKFTNALAVAVIVSVGWICYELYFKSRDVYNEQWRRAWIIPAFWQVLSFSLLCVICALWAPSQNSMRYSYSGDASEEFDKEETLTLIKPSQMPPSKDARNLPESKPEQDVVSFDAALEEDKRE